MTEPKEPQNMNANVTPEAEALHGEQAAEEKYEQPSATALDGDTLIADEPAEDDKS
jgi:hypothetical protein